VVKTLSFMTFQIVKRHIFYRCLIDSADVTSDLAGADALEQLRLAAGCLSRLHPEDLICDPAVDLLQAGFMLHPAPQLLLHLLDLITIDNIRSNILHLKK